MSMERSLLGAFMESSAAFREVVQTTNEDGSSFSDLGKVLFGAIKDYYSRDPGSEFIDRDTLLFQLQGRINNDKVFERVKDALSTIPVASVPNVLEAYRLQRRAAIGQELSAALLTGDDKRASELIKEYDALSQGLPGEAGSDYEVYHDDDLSEVIGERGEQPFRLYPRSLHDKTDGGATHGDHIVISGRVENGKSLVSINLACGLAHDGHRVLYVGNEDSPKRMIPRFVSRFSGMTKHQIIANRDVALRKARDNGYSNLIYISAAGGSPEGIAKLVQEHKPSVLTVDQIRNLTVGEDSKVAQIEKSSLAMRSIVKKHHLLGVSVSQQNNDEEHINSLVPNMGEMADSKIGLPGQADLMIMLGTNEDYRNRNMCMFSIPKNKLSGWHGAFPVQFNPALSKVEDL